MVSAVSDNKTILVVDDEENICHMLSLMLKKNGYQVRAVRDGESALKELIALNYDMVLCDIQMAGMSGMDLLEEIKARKIDVTVIMMSAFGTTDTAIEAMKKGAYDYISKPFRKDEVLLTLLKADERERLRRENLNLRESVEKTFSFANIIAHSARMLEIFRTIQKISNYKTTVLLAGESGTGKELIARAIHYNSNRAGQQFVAVNCGAIPEPLLESELFGHVKGAFTDASRSRKGLFAEADTGTLFLDEIGELPLNLQVKLLRVLQEGEIRRVGDVRPIEIDVRIIAASVHDLETLVKANRFREDLFYRLNVLPISLPPLRERREDISLLVRHFISLFNERLKMKVKGTTQPALKLLMDYGWPGNVRELENTIERAMVLTESDTLQPENFPLKIQQSKNELKAVLFSDELSIKKASKRIERILIQRALKRTKGNRTAASKLLEISNRALLYKIKEYEIEL